MRRTPERTNGLIKVPDELYSDVMRTSVATINVLRPRLLERIAADGQVMVQTHVDTEATVYGRSVPRLQVNLYITNTPEAVQDEGGVPLYGMFREKEAASSGYPELTLVLTPKEIETRESTDKALRTTHRVTLEHELRHFIQWILSRDVWPEREFSHFAGRPPRKAQMKTSEIRYALAPTQENYFLRDSEFHTLLGDLVNEYREDVAAGYVDLDRAMRELMHTEFFETLRKKSPERWKAAIRIAYGELSNTPVYENGLIRIPEELQFLTVHHLERLLLKFQLDIPRYWEASAPSSSLTRTG